MHEPPLSLGITFRGRVSPPPATMPTAGTTQGLESKHIPKGRVGQGSLETGHSLCNITAAPPAPQGARQHMPARCFTFWEERRRGSEVKVTSDS